MTFLLVCQIKFLSIFQKQFKYSEITFFKVYIWLKVIRTSLVNLKK